MRLGPKTRIGAASQTLNYVVVCDAGFFSPTWDKLRCSRPTYSSNKREKTADIWRRYHWFSRQMSSEKRAQKFHTDAASLRRSGQRFGLVKSNFPLVTTSQKHYPDLGSDASSVWNFCACFSDVIWREKPVVASPNVGCFLRLILH